MIASPPKEPDLESVPTYYRFWAKSRGGLHLLPYHSLDVAAVAQAILGDHPRLLSAWAQALSISATALRSWLVYLIALHDAGKFSVRFQGLSPSAQVELTGRTTAAPYEVRHDTLGALGFELAVRRPLAVAFAHEHSAWDVGEWSSHLRAWEAAVFGHHGMPPLTHRQGRPLTPSVEWTGAQLEPDVEGLTAFSAFSGDLRAVLRLGDPPIPSNPSEDVDVASARVRAASWHIAGFVVLCDWLGSSGRFARRSDCIPLPEYWEHALRVAREAVRESGVLPPMHSAADPVETVLGSLSPTPLQELAATQAANEPFFAILEDQTGSGKTEAALILAARAVAQKTAEGVYFGLPTMATANAMHARVAPLAARLYPGQGVKAVLAHSRAGTAAAHPISIQVEGGSVPSEPGMVPEAASWLADDRRKCLLAHLGIGTLDQVLLSVLPVRYQSLRLFGLTSRFLIVDEVHAYDRYALTLLKAALTFHASAGGSAVLLSATLPQTTRKELLGAFATGAQWAMPLPASHEYPLATVLTETHGIVERPLQPRAGGARAVRVEFVSTDEHAESILRDAVKEGRCACWIRNTVGDAVQAYRALADLRPILFHSRFTPPDRAAIEEGVLRRVGKESGPGDRAGALVIATQVVEQSLDIDFDVMVTDLAPVDLVVQRAGRLHRHTRDHGGARALVEARDPPTLHVFAPPWSENPNESWFSDSFPEAAFVYPAHDKLWLTMKTLREEQSLRLPDRARALVESVYGEAVKPPTGLARVAETAAIRERGRGTVAQVNALNLATGYSPVAGAWGDDAAARTRDGLPTRDLFLAMNSDSRLEPFNASWAESRVSIASHRIDSGTADPRASEALNQLPDAGRGSALVVLASEAGGCYAGSAMARGRKVIVRYSRLEGLTLEENP